MSGGRDFYVGYRPRAGAAVARFVSQRVAALFVLALLVALLVTMAQQRFANAQFEYGVLRDFDGIVSEFPYPTLLVARPGRSGAMPYSRYLLVAPGKRGADEAVAGRHGQRVRLSGTLIYRDAQTMIEIVPASLAARGAGQVDDEREPLGPVTLRGEIVDSKCYLGVMKPGQFKVHRACAVRCLSGGVPALLAVRGPDGTYEHVLLAGPDGRAINAQILDRVAEPVVVRGELERLGTDLLLRADPAAITRLDL